MLTTAEFPGGLVVKDLASVHFLAWELPHATGEAKKCPLPQKNKTKITPKMLTMAAMTDKGVTAPKGKAG